MKNNCSYINPFKLLHREKGGMTMMALMVMAILSIAGVYSISVSNTDLRITTVNETHARALYNSEAGVQYTFSVVSQSLKKYVEDNAKEINDFLSENKLSAGAPEISDCILRGKGDDCNIDGFSDYIEAKLSDNNGNDNNISFSHKISGDDDTDIIVFTIDEWEWDDPTNISFISTGRDPHRTNSEFEIKADFAVEFPLKKPLTGMVADEIDISGGIHAEGGDLIGQSVIGITGADIEALQTTLYAPNINLNPNVMENITDYFEDIKEEEHDHEAPPFDVVFNPQAIFGDDYDDFREKFPKINETDVAGDVYDKINHTLNTLKDTNTSLREKIEDEILDEKDFSLINPDNPDDADYVEHARKIIEKHQLFFFLEYAFHEFDQNIATNDGHQNNHIRTIILDGDGEPIDPAEFSYAYGSGNTGRNTLDIDEDLFDSIQEYNDDLANGNGGDKGRPTVLVHAEDFPDNKAHISMKGGPEYENINLITSGDIDISGSSKSGAEDLDVFLMAGGEVNFSGSVEIFSGVIWAIEDVDFSGASKMEGIVSAGGHIDMSGGLEYTYVEKFPVTNIAAYDQKTSLRTWADNRLLTAGP